MVRTQPPVPVQSPLHPVNTRPVAGAALSVTTVPTGKALLQLGEQLMPAGEDVTVPLPVTVTRSNGLNVATHDRLLVMTTVTDCGPPAQSPPQLPNSASSSATALSVNDVPLGNSSAHEPAFPTEQLIRPGLDTT